MRAWSPVRWIVALAAAAATVVLVAVPTALIPTGVFGRGVPAPWWAWPVLIVTAVLSGLVTATYVRAPDTGGLSTPDPNTRRAGLGGFLAYLAVGCPTCNKLALLALGSTGAVRWFAPVQPILALAAVALLGYALRRRLAAEISCPVPATRRSPALDENDLLAGGTAAERAAGR